MYSVPLKQDRIAYVYLLVDPRDKVPFYVGKTEKPVDRISGHITDGRKCRIIGAGTKASIIKEILESGNEPIMRIIEVTTNRYVDERELSWYDLLINRGYKITGEVIARIDKITYTDLISTDQLSLSEKLSSIKSAGFRRAIVYAIHAYMFDSTEEERKEFLEQAITGYVNNAPSR